jgi:O-antigen/teichoic acid export membrane protein
MSRRLTLLRRSFVLRPDDMGRKVINGASYQFAGIVLRTVLTIGSTALLARLLTPADFGYIAMATVVVELAALFSNFGFNALLIQRRVITRLQVDTVFWASLGLGLALAAVVVVASFFSSVIFADARVGELLRVLCLSFVFSSLGTIPNVVLMRLMRFQAEFWINMLAIVVRTAVAIALAWAGFGVWSLVAGAVTGVAVQWAGGMYVAPYWPRLRFHAAYLTGTWRTSSSYFAGGLLFYVNMNVDLLLIGRQLGATSLGYYQNARSLTDEIRSRIALPLQRVLFPAFASLQHDRTRMQAAVLRSASLLAAVTFPLGVGVSAMAEELVPILYGDQWLPMVPALGMFGLSTALRASMAIASPLFNAHDRVGLALRYSIVATALMVTGIWLTLPYGITAVSTAVMLTSLYALLPFVAALRLVGLGSVHAARILLPPALASGTFWIVIHLARPFATAWAPGAWSLLALGSALSLVLYVAILHAISRDYYLELRALLARK